METHEDEKSFTDELEYQYPDEERQPLRLPQRRRPMREDCDRQAKTWIENNKKTNCIIAMRTTTHKLLQKHGNFGPNVQAPKEYVVYEMPLDGSGDLQEQNGVTVDDPFTDTMWKDLLDEAYTPLYKDGNYTYGDGNGVYPTTSGL